VSLHPDKLSVTFPPTSTKHILAEIYNTTYINCNKTINGNTHMHTCSFCLTDVLCFFFCLIGVLFHSCSMPHQVPQKIKLQFYMADSTEGNKKHYNSTTSTTSTIFNTFTLTVGFQINLGPDLPKIFGKILRLAYVFPKFILSLS